MSESVQDRRAHPRQMKLVRVTIEHAGKHVEAVTADIGPSGAFVRTKEELTLGSSLPVKFQVPEGSDAKISAQARVVRAVRQPGDGGPFSGYGLAWIRFQLSGDDTTVRTLLDRYFGDADALPVPGGVPLGKLAVKEAESVARKAEEEAAKEALQKVVDNTPAMPSVQETAGEARGDEDDPSFPKGSWQAIRARALTDDNTDVEFGAVQVGTSPEVPRPRGSAFPSGGDGAKEGSDELSFSPSRTGPGRTKGDQDRTRPEWLSDPHGSVKPGGDVAPLTGPLTIEQLSNSGVPVDLPVTYRIRSLFFVGRVRVLSQSMVYVITLQQQPKPGDRVLVHVPVGRGPRMRTITLVSTVSQVDPPEGDDPGGFECSVSSVDEKGNVGAFRGMLRILAQHHLEATGQAETQEESSPK